MAISIQATVSIDFAGPTFDIAYPDDIALNDLLILVVGQHQRDVTDPIDWTQQLEDVASFASLSVFTKFADGDETGDLTVALSGNRQQVSYMLRVRGHDNSLGLGAIASSLVASGVTAFDPGVLLSFATAKDTTAPYTEFTIPAGMTPGSVNDLAQFNQQVGAWAYENVGTGPTGDRTWGQANGGGVATVNLFVPAAETGPVGAASITLAASGTVVRTGGNGPAPDGEFLAYDGLAVEHAAFDGAGVAYAIGSVPDPGNSGGTSSDLDADRMAYFQFGAPFRTDGRYKNGVLLGAAPTGAHEALPRDGNSNWDWYDGARWGEEPPWNNFMIPWYQIFRSGDVLDVNNEFNCRVQVRRVRMFIFRTGVGWERVDPKNKGDDVQMQAPFWNVNFTTVGANAAQLGIRSEGTDGGWSVRMFPFTQYPAAVVCHGYYSASFYERPPVPSGTYGIAQYCQMRIIQDTGSVNLNNASFIASMGSDHWPSAAGGRPPGTQITPFMQPRMVLLSPDWEWVGGWATLDWFTGSTPDLSKWNDSWIRANVPPGVTA